MPKAGRGLGVCRGRGEEDICNEISPQASSASSTEPLAWAAEVSLKKPLKVCVGLSASQTCDIIGLCKPPPTVS